MDIDVHTLAEKIRKIFGEELSKLERYSFIKVADDVDFDSVHTACWWEICYRNDIDPKTDAKAWVEVDENEGTYIVVNADVHFVRLKYGEKIVYENEIMRPGIFYVCQ